MGGRHAKPISLHLAQGNPARLTKAEIKKRQEAEVKLGRTDIEKLKPPDYVKNDILALRCWKQCIKDYKFAAKDGIELISSSDVGMLAMYCKTNSDYEQMMLFKLKAESSLEFTEILQLDSAINKKMDMLIKMQDRLFLNPLAKIKNVTKRTQKQELNSMQKAGFDL